MNAFDEAKGIEAQSMKIMLPLLEGWAQKGRLVLTDKGRLSKELQKRYGDVFLNGRNGEFQAIEMKAERSGKYGNFFLETWSNRSRLTVGWMISLRCDWLLYHFLEEDELYIIDFPRLQEWFYREEYKSHHPNYDQYLEKRQSKYTQLNDTWGRCVPCATVQLAVPTYLIRPQSLLSQGMTHA